MFSSNKRFCYILLSTALMFQCSNFACAQYETYKAKTIKNDNEVIIQNTSEIESASYFDDQKEQINSDNDISSLIAKKISNRKNKKTKEEIQEDTYLEETQQQNKYEYLPKETVEDKNKFQINANSITYNEEDGNLYAKDNVEIIAKEQNITLKADEAKLDKSTQTLNLTGNVRIIKDGVEMTGETLNIDLNEQNILMENPAIQTYSFNISAQEGYLIANDLQMLNGTIQNTSEQEVVIQSNGYNMYGTPSYEEFPKKVRTNTSSSVANKQKYTINAKEIILTSYKDHNSLMLKGSNVYYNKIKILSNMDFEILSDKTRQAFETSSPEFGSLRNFGTYFGYGQAFKLPKGQLLKIAPAITYGRSRLGVGLIGKYVTPNGRIQAGYSTSTKNLVVDGIYRLSSNLNLRYGRNTYIQEGIFGARRPGYAAQLGWQKSYNVKDLGIKINHGLYAGFYSDYKKHNLEHAYSTTRFRYSTQARKKLVEYKNKEQDVAITLSMQAEGAATLYGSGQTTAIARFGPLLTTKLKHWESALGYMLAGYHDDTPFVFDRYMYGHSSVMLNEKIHLNDKFAIGFKAYINPGRDNYKNQLLTESKLYAVAGPEDLKLALSYDFIRERAYFNIMFILGTDSSRINFDRLITKNADGANAKKDFYKRYNKTNIDI